MPRTRVVLAALTAAAALTGGVVLVSAPAEAKPRRITISLVDDAFMPHGTTTVPRGSTITYVWRGSDPHNVTITGPAAFSSRTQSDGRFVVHLTKAGLYHVVCTIHEGTGMTMNLKVTG